MQLRRVTFRDDVRGTTGGGPRRWSVRTGAPNWTVQTNTYQFANAAGSGIIEAPAENGTIMTLGSRLVAQENISGGMCIDVTMQPSNVAVGWNMGIYFYMSATPVATTGNGYLYMIDANTSTLYVATGGGLASIASAAVTHNMGSTYNVSIFYDPTAATGNMYVLENGTQVIAPFDETTYTSGKHLGLYALNGSSCKFSGIKVYRPWSTTWYSAHITHRLSDMMSECIFTVGRKDDTTTSPPTYERTEWKINDGVEVWLTDLVGPTTMCDFYGKIDKIQESGDQQIWTITATDPRSELLRCENLYTGAGKISDAITNIIDNQGRVCESGDVKASSDTGTSRTLNGRDAYSEIWSMASSQDYYIWYEPTNGALKITDTWSSSGLTIGNADVHKWQWVEDGYGICNTVKVYYAGASSTTRGGSGADYEDYGRRQSIVINTQIPNSTLAQNQGDFIVDTFKGIRKVIDVWCFDFHELLPGDTVTLNLGLAGVSSTTYSVLEKEYQTPGCEGIRFRLGEGSGYQRFNHTSASAVANKQDSIGKLALALQV